VVGGRRAVGLAGEQVVADWYVQRGCRVVTRNWRCREGEIDLVVFDPAERAVIVCEVKTRTGRDFGSPFEAVTPAKQRRLRRLAARFVSEARLAGGASVPRGRLRIDVAAVRPGPDGAAHVEVVHDAC